MGHKLAADKENKHMVDHNASCTECVSFIKLFDVFMSLASSK
jgi:hypothetical protein